jgi:hypothetical protein
MKLFRYRRPSIARALGISSAKSRFTRATGGRAVRHPTALLGNAERRLKRRVGYYAPLARAVRNRHRWLGWLKLW